MNKILRLTFSVVLTILIVFPVSSFARKNADPRMQTQMKRALPVWAQGRETEKNVYLGFRHIANLKKVPKKGIVVRLACSTNYRLTVNGTFVAHGPAVCAHDFYRIDEINIDPSLLHAGDNVLALEVAGYNVESYYLLNQPSFLQAEIEVGGKLTAWTGGSGFKAYELKYRHQDSPKLSFQRSTREDYTLSPDYFLWASVPSWSGAEVKLAPTGTKRLVARRVSFPDYTIHEASHLKGSADVWKFDTNKSGFLGLKVKVNEPTHIIIGFDEILQKDGHVNNRRLGYDASVTYDLAPGEYTLESFEPYTAQYVEIHTTKGHAEINRIFLRDYCNADAVKAKFECDNKGLEYLFEAARETHRQNAVDIFTDCPSRERAGWLCDSYFSSRVAFDMSGDTRVETNFLENFLLPEKFKDIDEGMLPMCYPSDHGNHNHIPNWAMWFVIELKEYIDRNGDRELADKLRPRVYALVNYFKPFLNSDGLLEKLTRWVFVEWSAANDYVQDVNYPSNMLYSGMLDAVADIYGDQELHVQAEKVRQTIRKQSFDGKFFIDNAVRKNGRLEMTNHHTEVCQYYAFFFNVATPELYPELYQKIINEFGPKRKTVNPYPDVPFANAFIGNYLRLEILSKQKLSRQILDETVAEYTTMVDQTGTLWENMTSVASCNHGFASHVAHVLLRDILGVYNVSVAKKQITLRFVDSGVKHCKATLPIGNNTLQVEWTRNGTDFNYKVKAPKGYTVTRIE